MTENLLQRTLSTTSEDTNHLQAIKNQIGKITAPIALCVATVLPTNGCSQDRPVYINDSNDGGSSSHDSGTSQQRPSTDAGYTGETLPGANKRNVWQVFSYDINNGDAYNTFEYYAAKGDALINCAESTSCMQAALNNTTGRQFQFLTEGPYSESFPGLLKGFCAYRNGDCGNQAIGVEAGYNCADSDGNERTCNAAGVLKLSESASGSPSGEVGPAHKIVIGFQNGDECQPAVMCVGSEHGFTFDDDMLSKM
jgi:hypothetical protein